MESPIIVLTTDFGAGSPAVGVMKGVILTINPQANIVDLTHQVDPQKVLQGARILGGSHRFFPQRSIHIAVVDPGVGTSRLGLLLTTPHGRFVGPDNGLFSNVIRGYMPHSPDADGPVPIPEGCSARILDQPRYWLDPVSNTFHGRDVFSPVAAHLSLGVPDAELGPPAEQMDFLTTPQPSIQNGEIHGEVISADHFGNLVTNITAASLSSTAVLAVGIKGRRIPGLSKTFHDHGPAVDGVLVALISSSGYLEIAVRDGSAAQYLEAGVGEAVIVQLGH
ncbi:MAG: hypothetical protein BZY80_05145 [SAR202 cluster bacterium Io17-Chloro-G2]|nr:MAG: hypothetical protein BZY80_05145 [SAR202 cluster bacterium Io17-Chloro-G2]